MNDEPDTEYFTLGELTQLRHALSCFNNPSEALTKAITTLDDTIASIINSITQDNA